MKKRLILSCLAFSVCMMAGCAGNSDQSTIKSEPYIMIKENVCTLKDGTCVSLWKPHEESLICSYRLENGQELLESNLPATIDNSYTAGLKGYHTMDQKALTAALDYYENQESKLDMEVLLENAYEDYTSQEKDNKKFIPHFAEEDVSPCVETERFTGFLTTVDVPEPPDYESTETKTVTLFDRKTGDVIPAKDLFTISEEEAIAVLAEFCPVKNQNDLKSFLHLEDIVWMQDAVWIYAPKELQTDENPMWSVDISYDELKDYLYPWAIPEA